MESQPTRPLQGNQKNTACNDIAITEQQRSVIDLSTSTFQVSPEGLLDAINDLKRSSRLLAPGPRRNRRDHPTTMGHSAMMPLSVHTPCLPEYSFTPLRSQDSFSDEPTDMMNSESSQSRPGNIFGFRITDCFASMVPFNQPPTPVQRGTTHCESN